MTKLQTVHKKFIEKLKADGKSEATLVAYNKDIEQIVTFLAKEGVDDVEGMKIEHLESFMKSLANENYTPKSISRKTNAARTFIKYLNKEGILKEDISDQLKHPKFETKAPRILTKLEYRALRDAAKDDNRSYAMIEVLLQAGITISELAGMKLEDLDIKGETGSLFIARKNNREERIVPLNKAAVEALSKYINNTRVKSDKSTNVFITKSGRPLLIRNIRSTIDRFFRLAGVENAKVNDLRHTFVANHIRNGVNITYLAKVAGHKRISTTEKYLDYVEKPEKMDKTELSIL
ncbi:tyrosine-type recombinase/integrase [candidate division WWE3 bacterium]|uniref:Tyrosine-type recombinase/integrase n=1 Tax=candidate division WWE3 bacterium TaxID=2053526 RepID=A0A7X9E698_UNCKA|nr:tyrosine-type recombinase/integrase [candidate division WWE3 bacterium]